MEIKIRVLFRNQSGAALVIALTMVVVMTLIVLAASLTSIYEIKLAGNKRGSADAFFAADSGVQITMARAENFDLPGKYVGEKYNPLTDSYNPNPTQAKVVIQHSIKQKGAPRGFGISATNVNFEHYLIESTGQDQMESGPIKSTCTIQQKVVKIVPLP
jgi:hypothetical protein